MMHSAVLLSGPFCGEGICLVTHDGEEMEQSIAGYAIDMDRG